MTGVGEVEILERRFSITPAYDPAARGAAAELSTTGGHSREIPHILRVSKPPENAI